MYVSGIFVRRGALSATTAAMTMFVAGCFFDQLQQSQENDIHRVEQKQVSLQAEQTKSGKLRQEEEQLAVELEARELTLAELNERVEALNAKNGLVIADNDEARLRYRDRLAQLHEYNLQIAATRVAPDSIEERRERLEALKIRLREQLDAMLH